jgi:ubiquitin-protein ligase
MLACNTNRYSLYEGGNFYILIRFPSSGRSHGPAITFITPIYHPRVDFLTGGWYSSLSRLESYRQWYDRIGFINWLTILDYYLCHPLESLNVPNAHNTNASALYQQRLPSSSSPLPSLPSLPDPKLVNQTKESVEEFWRDERDNSSGAIRYMDTT